MKALAEAGFGFVILAAAQKGRGRGGGASCCLLFLSPQASQRSQENETVMGPPEQGLYIHNSLVKKQST